jgi:L-iditol 2-dehydrogenase
MNSTEHQPDDMPAARLHGPGDIRIDRVPCPGKPDEGEVLLRVKAVGICGSDLHTYADGRIGDTVVQGPFILGHEFSGVVEAACPGAHDGLGRPLGPGTPVAVDPARPCRQCEFCRAGNTNLCTDLHFAGHWPEDGALRPLMRVPASSCFPIPQEMDPAVGALLETLGVAMHAAGLAHLAAGRSVAVLGAGPVGLCVLQMIWLAGADPMLVTDRLPCRLDLVERLCGQPIDIREEDPVAAVLEATNGRGVDVAIEAAFSSDSLQQAADMLRPGGRMVVVGIPGDDRFTVRHSTIRRKGITIALSRRMKDTYPEAIELVTTGQVDLAPLVSHRFPLEKAAEAFALNARYAEGVVKVIVDVG